MCRDATDPLKDGLADLVGQFRLREIFWTIRCFRQYQFPFWFVPEFTLA